MDQNLEKYIQTKKSAEKKVMIGGILAILGVVLFILSNEITILLGIVGFVVGVIFLGIGLSAFSTLRKRFKIDVVTKLVESFVDDGHFDANSGLSQTNVYATEFLKPADRFHSEDFLQGSMDGVRFVSSDVVLEERHVEHTKDGTREYYETYFKGRVFIFDFNKPFEGYLQVLEKGSPYKKRDYKKVNLESVAFNKKFRTFASNEHSAFYVLTPHFMEALMNFEKNNKGSISFSFLGNYLYIGINNFRDTFEIQMFRTLDQSIFEEFKRDLFVIKEVITELRLNNNIFKKGE